MINFDKELKKILKRAVKGLKESDDGKKGGSLTNLEIDNVSIIIKILELYPKEDRVFIAKEIGLEDYSPAYIGDFS